MEVIYSRAADRLFSLTFFLGKKSNKKAKKVCKLPPLCPSHPRQTFFPYPPGCKDSVDFDRTPVIFFETFLSSPSVVLKSINGFHRGSKSGGYLS
ncbi:MAG: hypothetical protein AAGA66_11675, partial [Bacteroidota bacterium]